MRARTASGDVRSPLGWLVVAFFGVWLYLITKILQWYSEPISEALGVELDELYDVLVVTAGAGSFLLLAGLIAALWRANLAAGLSPAGPRGLVLGAAGLGILLVFEVALVLDLFRLGGEPIRSLVFGQPVGDVIGNALSFAGLASLAVGLAHAASLFGRTREAGTAPTAPPSTERPT